VAAASVSCERVHFKIMVSYRDATFCVAQLWRDSSVRGKTQTRGRNDVAVRCERAHFRLWSASWCRHTAAPLTVWSVCSDPKKYSDVYTTCDVAGNTTG